MKSKAAVRTWDSTDTGVQYFIFENPMDNLRLSFYGITSGFSATVEEIPAGTTAVPIDGYTTVGASGSDINYAASTDSGRVGTSFLIPGKRRGIKIAVTLGATTSLQCYAEPFHSGEVQGKAIPATVEADGANAVTTRI